MKMYHPISIFVLLQFFSCTDANSPSFKSSDNEYTTEVLRIDTVWTKVIPSDRAEIISRQSITPILRGTKVIVSSYDLLSTEFEVVSCFDKTNGNLLWSWKDYTPSQYGESICDLVNRDYIFQENKFLLPSENGNYIIDSESGSSINKHYFGKDKLESFGNSNSGFTSCNNKIYRTFDKGEVISSSFLCEVGFDDLKLKEVFRIDSSNNYMPSLCNPAITQNDNGELLIIAPIRYASTDWRKEKGEVYCYNYTTKKVEWHLKDFTGDKMLVNLHSKVYNDKFYFIAGKTAFCLNVSDGSTIWKSEISTISEISYKFTIFDDKLYIPLNDGAIACLDAQTGNINWKHGSPKIASSADLLVTDKYIFICDKRLCILDRYNGNLLKIYKSPKASSIYNDTYIYSVEEDPSTGLLYFTDGYFLICAKLIAL